MLGVKYAIGAALGLIRAGIDPGTEGLHCYVLGVSRHSDSISKVHRE